jgi:hypothetical protein
VNGLYSVFQTELFAIDGFTYVFFLNIREKLVVDSVENIFIYKTEEPIPV